MKRRTFVAGCAGATVSFAARSEPAIPQSLATNLVTIAERTWNGQACLAVELADDEQKLRLQRPGGGNRPSIASVHEGFTDGIIEVTLGAELTGKGAPDDRGFVGVSFHIGPQFTSHETVYLRMTNGRLNDPPPPSPRIERAIQYVADPGFHFNQSREQFPGRYEKGADIGVGRWHRLRLEIRRQRLRALVDGNEVLVVEDLRFAGRQAPVGLFVGDGSRGFFRDFSARPG